jgi:hypothetical protein
MADHAAFGAITKGFAAWRRVLIQDTNKRTVQDIKGRLATVTDLPGNGWVMAQLDGGEAPFRIQQRQAGLAACLGCQGALKLRTQLRTQRLEFCKCCRETSLWFGCWGCGGYGTCIWHRIGVMECRGLQPTPNCRYLCHAPPAAGSPALPPVAAAARSPAVGDPTLPPRPLKVRIVGARPRFSTAGRLD